MTRAAALILITFLFVIPLSFVPATADEHSPFTDDDSEADTLDAGADAQGDAISISGEAGVDPTPGVQPVSTSGSSNDPGAEPEGFWVSWTIIDGSRTPPCIRLAGELLDVPTRADADQVEADRRNAGVQAYESYISGGNPPPQPCPGEDPGLVPGIDPSPARRFADEAIELLPVSDPSISGGYAITGLRSWYDLGRPSTYEATRTLDLGPFSREATLTATVVASVDVGDGTPSFTTTARGGGYHDGNPGPDDIVHTYVDRTETQTFTVTDTWTITVTVDGVAPIQLTHTMEPVSLGYPVREVRSVRDS